MGHHVRAPVRLGAAAFAVACVLIDTATSVEVDPQSYQGRTEAAIREFRAAIELSPNLEHGKALFASCAECHQADGSGSASEMIPVIAGQHVSVLVKQLVDFRHDRRWNARMQATLQRHELDGAQDLLDVAAYAQSLKRPAPAKPDAGDPAAWQEGRRIYYRDCEGCHGRLGEGDLRTVKPRLAGQHYTYLRQQLVETASGVRPGMDEDHVKRIGALTDAQRAAVADYLAHLSPEFSSTN